MTPHLNRLDETVQMRGQSICFYAEFTKLSLIILKYSFLSRVLLIEGVLVLVKVQGMQILTDLQCGTNHWQ